VACGRTIPVRGVERRADGQRSRRLSETEYAALGNALRTLSKEQPITTAAVRFLAFTGWRRGEMLSLKWTEIDLVSRTARLADTKTGASVRPLSHAACNVPRELPRLSALMFPASPGADKPMRGLPKAWARIAKASGLPPDITPHTLRHSFASVAADLGFSELTIAALLGHKKASITSRYAHHADAVLLQAADRVGEQIAEFLGEAAHGADVVPLRAV
jgi:integrase